MLGWDLGSKYVTLEEQDALKVSFLQRMLEDSKFSPTAIVKEM